MAGSNFHLLRFRGGQCIRTSNYNGDVKVFDSTPKWATPEPENLVNKTIIKQETNRMMNYYKG